jgi:hypothetical protein
VNTARMRRRADAVRRRSARARTWNGNRLYERCGWEYVGEPDASMVLVRLEPDVGLHYAMPRGEFDAMDDSEFTSRMEAELIKWVRTGDQP